MSPPSSIHVLDSHTGGEPTRLVIDGGPDLGHGPLAERARLFREKFDRWRSAIVNEPRGSDVMVGALLVAPHTPGCDVGVIFFNNVGLLGMCGHGTIGLVASLAYLGRLSAGIVRIDTPVGSVSAELHPNGEVSVTNIPSRRLAKAVTVNVPGHGDMRGDVAWSGNGFFLAEQHVSPLTRDRLDALTALAWDTRRAINAQGFSDVDHVEFFGPPVDPQAHSRNFVLCPGRAYDRSPCGTGTSAKLACLAADGTLAEGETWIQEGILGSTFTGRYRWHDRARGEIIPTITGRAHIIARSEQIFDPTDPFVWGIRAGDSPA